MLQDTLLNLIIILTGSLCYLYLYFGVFFLAKKIARSLQSD